VQFVDGIASTPTDASPPSADELESPEPPLSVVVASVRASPRASPPFIWGSAAQCVSAKASSSSVMGKRIGRMTHDNVSAGVFDKRDRVHVGKR
jgi:hypothetical protein